MPPIRNKSSKDSAEQEGRILSAISDFQNSKIPTIRRAAKIYNVPRTTLQNRLNGIQQRSQTRANSHKLTESEEESLIKWILDLEKRGLPPRPSLVREMANYILSQHGNQQVGGNWVYNLAQRRTELKARFTGRYNYGRARCQDPKIIQKYFDDVRDAITQYGILPEDIYNFDEIGFAMGLCASAKVVTGSDRYGRPYLLQPGNREWVTAIEAVNSTGWALPSYMIFKASKYSQDAWFETLPDDWKINNSDNGWTTNKIGMDWLINHFIPHTNDRTMGKYRMLILDGHGSHLTAEFDRTCTDNYIIPICMPPHSFHLLQPLNVSCFAVLKQQYGQLVEQRMRHGFNHIDKINFFTAFSTARATAYKAETVRNSFIATGLVPFDPERVSQKLTIQLRTSTPPSGRSSNTQSSSLQTPPNPHQFKRQMTTIKSRISRSTRSSSKFIDEAIDRILKAYEMSFNELLILRKELHDLRAAREEEKQKRRSQNQISHAQAITRGEAQALVQGQIEASQTAILTESEPPASTLLVRRQFRCSECNILGHRRPQCPNLTNN